jgi:three-Cys-motif partner protein
VVDIVQQLNGRELGLAFVDPEGFEVHFKLFETLSRRAVDIVFLFPSGIGIVRNLSTFVKQTHCGLDDLWGNRSWRELPMARLAAGSMPPPERIDEGYYQSWALAFCQRVASLGYKHYDAVGPLRNEQKVPMYHLLFFSKHEAGLKIWRGIGRIDPRGQRSLSW